MQTQYLHGEDFFFISLLRFCLIISEHKDVASCRVPMKVAEEENISTLKSALHHELRMVIDGVELARGTDPLPVEVLAHESTAVVSNNDSVWIQHWHNFVHKSVS